MSRLTYNPTIFDQPNLAAAKRIILTPTAARDSETRWQRETPYLAQLLVEHMALGPDQTVVDYGCGVGRIAKELIELSDCRVLGVDISEQMRALAPEYVASSSFRAESRRSLQELVHGGFRADAAFAVWVLQHSVQPAEDVALLATALKPGAPFVVVNSIGRLVPTVEKPWANDGLDVVALLDATFGAGQEISLDPAAIGEVAASQSWCRLYRAR